MNHTNEGNENLGWNGGFDVVLGNPPWDKIQPEETKFFSGINDEIANATGAKRKKLIEDLNVTDPDIYQKWAEHKRFIGGLSNIVKQSEFLPLTSEGNLNSYRLFAELGTYIISSKGRAGMIVQTGLATDETSQTFLKKLMEQRVLEQFWDFENRQGFFPDVDSRFRFALVILSGRTVSKDPRGAEFGWLLHNLSDIQIPSRTIRLTAVDLLLFNPNSGTAPVFPSERDLEINRTMYKNSKHIFKSEADRFANIDFQGELFNMTRDSKHFVESINPESSGQFLPLYEAKLIHQFDHRYGCFENGEVKQTDESLKADPSFIINPRFFVAQDEVESRVKKQRIERKWMIGFRSVSSATNERTSIASILPFSAVANSINLILGLDALKAAILCANCNTFVFDYACRQKLTGMNVNIWIMKQLPILPESIFQKRFEWLGCTLQDWLIPRVLELSFTAWDLKQFALDLGYSGPPFIWHRERRFILRCEIDAAFFHLYGVKREDVDYIMESFPIVKRNDTDTYSAYRTKRVILECYDAMSKAIETGRAFSTMLEKSRQDIRIVHLN